MKNKIIQFSTPIILAGVLVFALACNKEYQDPSRATQNEVFSSPKGLTGVVIGLQRVYTAGRASSLYNKITANGFVTNELVLLNPGNIPELQLSTGGATVDGTNTVLAGLWSSSNKIIYDADLVITNSQNLADKNYASGLIAYATIFKALALGDLSMYWQKVPAQIGQNANFVDRVDGFNRAIAAIDQALAAINANAISATFLANIPPGVDIVNTLNALKARYALFAGNLPLALTAANNVDLTKASSFQFDAITLNPIFETATSTNNVFQPVNQQLGLTGIFQPDPADNRIAFYTTLNPNIAPLVRINGFGATASTPIPIYLPGEITLIKAEVFARQSDLTSALIELNKVVTKTPASDPFGVGANLPPIVGPLSQQDLLDQIYKQRCIELFMSGLKLEDMRRFNRPATERKRDFFPYPFVERDNNPNTPADPPF
ncbi:MAG TPA: RagB/SusD family protein [Daejeonella sp.]|nr:RagB/SusD family protein [Daejeonella sp.]